MFGIDTETQDGKAILVCTSRGDYWEWDSTVSDEANFLSLIKFLCQWSDERISFNLQFDFQSVMAWSKNSVLWELARLNHSEIMLDGKILEIDWIPGKRASCEYDGRKFFWYDVYQYYRMSLADAAEKILKRKKHDLVGIDITKMARALASHHRPQVLAYCINDADLALGLWCHLYCQFKTVDIDCANPISSAYIAGRNLMSNGFKLPKNKNEKFRLGYHGGRIECLQRGTFENVWLYDIRSAYPSVAATLPHPNETDYVFSEVDIPTAWGGVVYCDFAIPDYQRIAPVAIEQKVLIYPVGNFESWVDLDTYRAARARGWVRKAESFLLACSPPQAAKAWPRIESLYQMRLDSPDVSLAVKTCLNGLYGKLAQSDESWEIVDSIDDADLFENEHYLRRIVEPGFYQNFLYAAKITGAIRRKLFEAVTGYEREIIAFATDSIISRCALPHLKIGKRLGDWSAEKIERLTYIGCGTYQAGEKSVFRGFSTKRSLRDLLFNVPEYTYAIDVPTRQPLTILWSLKNGRPINEIREIIRELDLNFDKKRTWEKSKMYANDFLTSRSESRPIII